MQFFTTHIVSSTTNTIRPFHRPLSLFQTRFKSQAKRSVTTRWPRFLTRVSRILHPRHSEPTNPTFLPRSSDQLTPPHFPTCIPMAMGLTMDIYPKHRICLIQESAFRRRWRLELDMRRRGRVARDRIDMVRWDHWRMMIRAGEVGKGGSKGGRSRSWFLGILTCACISPCSMRRSWSLVSNRNSTVCVRGCDRKSLGKVH